MGVVSDVIDAIAAPLGRSVPSVGALWTDLWPAVVVFVAVALLQGYINVREEMSRNTWNEHNPVERLVFGLQDAGERFFLWASPPYGFDSLVAPFRWAIAIVGRWLQLGLFGDAGARLKARTRALLRRLSFGTQVGVLAVASVVGAYVMLGLNAASTLTLLTTFDPTTWGIFAALGVGALGYAEPVVAGLPGADSLAAPQVALYAFVATFALVWAIDRFLWWRALNQQPILRFIKRVLGR